jgi:hypothetical protein
MGGVVLWNAILRCTNVYSHLNQRNFKTNKNYQVRNGKLIDGNGDESFDTYNNLAEIKESFYAEFEEVKNE